MVKKIIFILVVTLFFILILDSCHKTNRNISSREFSVDNLKGEWSCCINLPEYSGKETIKFSETFFSVTDTLLFAAEDNGFKFSMNLITNSGGTWFVRKDSIFLNYKEENIDITPRDETFLISTIENLDTIHNISNNLKEEMRDKLSEYLISSQEENFRAICGQHIAFGKIKMLISDTLFVENNGVTLLLYRNH